MNDVKPKVLNIIRSSRSDVSCKKKVFLKFYKTHRKTPVSEFFLNQVTGLSAATLFKKRLAQEFCEIFKNTYFHRTHPVAASV